MNKANINSKQISKLNQALLNLINQLHNYSTEENKDNQNMLDCKYRRTEYFKKLTFLIKTICSNLFKQKNFDNFHILLKKLKSKRSFSRRCATVH